MTTLRRGDYVAGVDPFAVVGVDRSPESIARRETRQAIARRVLSAMAVDQFGVTDTARAWRDELYDALGLVET